MHQRLWLACCLLAACGDDSPTDDPIDAFAPADAARPVDAMSPVDGFVPADLGCGDVDDDPDQCGSCDNVCPVVASATRTCTAGACGFQCDTDRSDCDGDGANGCEVDVASDLLNCGACGTECPALTGAAPTCVAGTCGYACELLQLDCDADGANGCEVDGSSDLANCGGCGTICSATEPNTEPLCDSGVCATTCTDGFADCDASPGCETSLEDPDDCGACGNVCGAGEYCLDRTCRRPLVFVSSVPLPVEPGELYTLGDPLTVVQTHCNTLAAAAGLGGRYDAWFSTSTSTPSSRFVRSPIGWERPDGVVVADDWSDLTDLELDARIDRDETGATVATGATFMGLPVGYSCGGIEYQVVTGSRAVGLTETPGRKSRCSDWRSVMIPTSTFGTPSAFVGSFSDSGAARWSRASGACDDDVRACV